MHFIGPSSSDNIKYQVAERFVSWLEKRVIEEARGDNETETSVDPEGRFWLGRLGPKDHVTLPDDRGDRLEPCAIGVKVQPAGLGPWRFSISVKFCIWHRSKSEEKEKKGLRWNYRKLPFIELTVPVEVTQQSGTILVAKDELTKSLLDLGAESLSAEIRVHVSGRSTENRSLEITLVNTSNEDKDYSGGRFFEASLSVADLQTIPFQLESLPDSFRFNREVEAYGINCGTISADEVISTSDSPSAMRYRPNFWPSEAPEPDFSFKSLAVDPSPTSMELLDVYKKWAADVWSSETLSKRAEAEGWTLSMREEAGNAKADFSQELSRIERGVELLSTHQELRRAFTLMNEAMEKAAKGRYSAWRPFQFAFLLANLECLASPEPESNIVDIVWFATGGGKTETYLGLLITAAFMDRMRGKISGVTAWSRFPLRMLSLQQTQRFANALAAAELVRLKHKLAGDPFSLGFLVGGGATPNRIKKESSRGAEDADTLDDRINPFKLLDQCPFCREQNISTTFDRVAWRLNHICGNEECPTEGNPLPIFIVDDEIWRFLPTIVIGTLDKAANIARQTGMRGIIGSPNGLCKKEGHGYTYACRNDFPNGCLVPDCKGGVPGPLPMPDKLYASSFRLQDELHLLRDSLGAVDAHYEAALDAMQVEVSGCKPKILASSATLSGYEKQVEVLYSRDARVFPQLPPVDGKGFWNAESSSLMRKFIALAPRRLTVEFVVDRLIISLMSAIQELRDKPNGICASIYVDNSYAPFLMDIYGTDVVYGNTLQDIDAVIRSSETQYSEITTPPNVATLTGRTHFSEVRDTLNRLENPETIYEDRLHLIAASSMMSHGVDIDRLNVMIMLALPLGVAEFIQATARVGRRWPALVMVVPKMARERDASVYRAFPEFITHGDRFVEPIPITRKSRRVLERTISGLELARINMIHEPATTDRMTTIKHLNEYLRSNPEMIFEDELSIARALGISEEDEFMRTQLADWFEGFKRNLRHPPADARFLSDLCPTGAAMTSLRDVEEQAPIKGNSTA